MKSFAVTLVVMAYCNPALSDGRNATFAVTATVTKACSISGISVPLESLDVSSASPSSAMAILTSTCTQGSGYAIGLGPGTVSGTGLGRPQAVTVYGHIPAEQIFAAGTSSDFIIATIDF